MSRTDQPKDRQRKDGWDYHFELRGHGRIRVRRIAVAVAIGAGLVLSALGFSAANGPAAPPAPAVTQH